MNFLLALFLLEILKLDTQNGALMILPMQMVAHSIPSHHQEDIKNYQQAYSYCKQFIFLQRFNIL